MRPAALFAPALLAPAVCLLASTAHAEDRSVTLTVNPSSLYSVRLVDGFQTKVNEKGLVTTRLVFSQRFVPLPEATEYALKIPQPAYFNVPLRSNELDANKEELEKSIRCLVPLSGLYKFKDEGYVAVQQAAKAKPESLYFFGDLLANRRRALSNISRGSRDITITSVQLAEMTKNLSAVAIVTDPKAPATGKTAALSVGNLKKHATWTYRAVTVKRDDMSADVVEVNVSWTLEVTFDATKQDITAFATSDLKLPQAISKDEADDSNQQNGQTPTSDAESGLDFTATGFFAQLANRPGIETVVTYLATNTKPQTGYGFEFSTPGSGSRKIRIPLPGNGPNTNSLRGLSFDAARLRFLFAVDKDEQLERPFGGLSWPLGPHASLVGGYSLTFPQNTIRVSPAVGVAIKFSLSALGGTTPGSGSGDSAKKPDPGPIAITLKESRTEVTRVPLAKQTANVIFTGFPQDTQIRNEESSGKVKQGQTFIDWREAGESVVQELVDANNVAITRYKIEKWDDGAWKPVAGNPTVSAGETYRVSPK